MSEKSLTAMKSNRRQFLKCSALAGFCLPARYAKAQFPFNLIRVSVSSGATFPSSGLVSYWKFDETTGNAADQIGGNTLTNNNVVTYAPAKINNGAAFVAASSQSLSCTGTNTRLTGALSLNLWVNVLALPAFAQTMELIDNFQFNASGYQLAIVNNTVTSNFVFSLYKSSNTAVTVSDPSVTPTATWTMLTATWDGTTMTLYRNGTSVATTALSASLGAYAPPSFSVGSGYGNMYLGGGIDELGLWNRALTSTEVTTLYNSNVGLTYP